MSSQHSLVAVRGGLPEAVGRLLDQRVGKLSGEVGRAATAINAFLVFSIALCVAYAIFFSTYDREGLRALIAIAVGAGVAYIAALVLVRMGHQLTATLVALTTAIVQIVVLARWIGWESGIHLYLIAGGQLVFMVFTQPQRALRAVYASVAVLAFFYCQLMVPAGGLGYAFPSSVLRLLFPLNATLTLALVYTLAAVSHYRGIVARLEADEAAARAEYLARTDALTGLANRRPVLERLDQLSGSGRYSLAIADLDHFKALNDTYGHTCGDRVLAALGERFRTQLRATDAVGRWGGEEFIFVMADATIDDAMTMMERMRRSIEKAPIPCTGHAHDVTMSVGVADEGADHISHRVIRRADDALYEAKQAGRNRVHASPAPQPVSTPPEGSPKARRRRS